MTLPASSWFDPVVGLDVHWEMVPTPAPVPTPIPNPFTGIVFDPMGLAAGLAISNAIGAVMGASFKGPVVYWGAIPATNTGTEAKHVPGHILIPPGTAWAPFPRTPKPTIHPGETPKPPSPVKPYDDASVVFGSKTVSVGGSNAVRMGDIALSCSEPVRLPSSFVIAIPKGAPILIGGPPSLDLMAAVMASLKTRFMSDSLHALISRMKPSRLRSILHKGACLLTGHPVDVATGRVLTDCTDAVLPGPMPLRIERSYNSAFASRDGALGRGWSTSLDQAIWEERGQVVWRAADGRELVFDTFDLPGRRMHPGDAIYHPIDRVTLRREDEAGAYTVVDEHGNRYAFARVSDSATSKLIRAESPCRNHAVEYHHDERGWLSHVRDSSGRTLRLEHDADGRITALKLPRPRGGGHFVHRRYAYDDEGNLVEVTDAAGARFTYDYVTHLLVRETDREGLSFYFEYDGFGDDAWCTRTWGDGGIHDHRLAYDKRGRKTFVTDSLGNTSQYHMNVAGLVVKTVDPLGGTTEHAYDPDSLRRTSTVDPLGRTASWSYDDGGRLIEARGFDGATVRHEHDAAGKLVRTLHHGGGETRWVRDSAGRAVEQHLASGEVQRAEFDNGLLVGIIHPSGDRVELAYDAQRMLAAVRYPDGSERRYDRDALGRVVAERTPRGPTRRYRYDAEGRLVVIESRIGLLQQARYDAEGNLLELEDSTHRTQLSYAGFHRNVARTAGPPGSESTVRWDYDLEGRLTTIVNEAGEAHRFELDPAGRLVSETDFDGRTTRYELDAAGRRVAIVGSSGARTTIAYDEADRRTRVEHHDGSFLALTYDAEGRLASAKNETGEVTLERDALGRIMRETQAVDGGSPFEVRSRYAPGLGRIGMETSLGARVALDQGDRGLRALRIGGAHRELAVELERDSEGLEVARTLPGAVHIDWARDEEGRPTLRRIRRGSDELGAEPYSWRGADRLTRIGDRAFGYDARGRVVAERPRDPDGDLLDASAPSTEAGLTWEEPTELDPAQPFVDRALDEVDNVFRRLDHSDRRYGAGGRLLEANGVLFDYDADGRRIRRTEPDGRVWDYAWDGHGNLTEVSRPDGVHVRMRYDAFCRRVERKLVRVGEDGHEQIESRTSFHWDGDDLVHEVHDGEATTWYWEPGNAAPVFRERGTERWAFARDHLGSPTAAFDELGREAWRAQLDLFGVADVAVGEREAVPFRFPGQYDDAETGLYVSRFRHYDPETGAFLTPDPAGRFGGLRPYAYVADPLRFADPLGLTGNQCAPTEERQNTWNEFQKHHAGQFSNPTEAAAAYRELVNNQSPWPHGFDTNAAQTVLPPGTTFEMAVAPGQPPTSPGGFGSMDPITSQAYVRNELAVKTDWKPSVDRVVTYEVVTPLPATVGPVGPQVEPGNFLPGGGQQVQMNVPGPDRMSYLKVVSVRTLGP